jgi:enoyl-CoA hydratase/carnithine racemase
LLGERFTPEEAREVGIVNRVIADETLMDEVMEIARRLARKSPAGLMATKHLIKGHTAQNVRDAILTDGEMFAQLMAGPQAREAFEAFAAKREPDFSKF